MAAGYWRAGMTGSATFELFVRRLPPERSYLIVAGIEQAVEYLEQMAFDEADREWLKALPQFSQTPSAFFDDYLAHLRFTGDVWAMPEGTPVFANEPIVRIVAPMPEAQLVETALLAVVGFQTSVAAKAARIVTAARGRRVVEFGARRAHAVAGAIDAARAAFIGGCAGTSFVAAAKRFGIPAFGTMAHSWVQAFPTELDAFREFSRTFGDSAVYLLDTYDTVAAARRLTASGLRPSSVRLDSGDLVPLGRAVRDVLDEAGLTETRIFATGDLDEYKIAELVAAGACIDAFGVGTALTTVNDAPALSAVYKLVEIDRRDVVKLSPGKETWPGAKQVWRVTRNRDIVRDVIASTEEPGPVGGVPLLRRIVQGGRRLADAADSLSGMRERCREGVASLPPELRTLGGTTFARVEMSDTLQARRAALMPR